MFAQWRCVSRTRRRTRMRQAAPAGARWLRPRSAPAAAGCSATAAASGGVWQPAQPPAWQMAWRGMGPRAPPNAGLAEPRGLGHGVRARVRPFTPARCRAAQALRAEPDPAVRQLRRAAGADERRNRPGARQRRAPRCCARLHTGCCPCWLMLPRVLAAHAVPGRRVMAQYPGSASAPGSAGGRERCRACCGALAQAGGVAARARQHLHAPRAQGAGRG